MAQLRHSPPFHVMTKPSGAACNLDCRYCFYLEKQKLLPGGASARMNDTVLESYIRQYLASQHTPEVNFAWQGGEPTLMGLDFFHRVIDFQSRHAHGKRVTNSIQTNGTLLDDDWGRFLARYRFLVGISIDGPPHLHDHYRRDKGDGPTFDRVLAGLRVLQRHRVNFNTLTVVNRVNAVAPVEVYEFLKKLGSRYLQFIPLVERSHPTADPAISPHALAAPADEAPVTEWSVPPDAFGRFLIQIFDRWVRRDVGKIFVQTFDATLGSWAGAGPGVCIFSERCGSAVALEHNGDVYPCDHYVYPDRRLGNLLSEPLEDLVNSPTQAAFGRAKSNLTTECRRCPFLFACHGDCPKHRFATSSNGEPGHSYLCPGYLDYFDHVAPHMDTMTSLLRANRPASDIIAIVRKKARLPKTAAPRGKPAAPATRLAPIASQY